MSRVAVSFRQTRKRMPRGLYASLTPLRFAGGGTDAVRRGRKFSIQRVEVDGREMLYVLNFYLPRFLDLGFPRGLTTIAHELLHIGPNFDGDLRRFPGGAMPRATPRGNSTPRPSSWPSVACRRAGAIALRVPAPGLSRLQALHGGIYGRRIAAPKLCRRSEPDRKMAIRVSALSNLSVNIFLSKEITARASCPVLSLLSFPYFFCSLFSCRIAGIRGCKLCFARFQPAPW